MLTAQLPKSMLCKAKIVATPPWIHYRKKRFKAIFYRIKALKKLCFHKVKTKASKMLTFGKTESKVLFCKISDFLRKT